MDGFGAGNDPGLAVRPAITEEAKAAIPAKLEGFTPILTFADAI